VLQQRRLARTAQSGDADNRAG